MANLYDQNQYLYNPTNKDKLGLGIGSLISAALASMGGNNTREALIRAAAGGLAGYGSGWKGMQDQYGEVFRRAMDDRQLQNQEQSMAIRNALGIENQGLRREQFEANKPLIEARTERLKNPPLGKPPKEPDYLSKMEGIDTRIADLEFKDPAQGNPAIQASINSLRNIKAQYHNKLYGGGTSVKNLGFDFNAPPQQASAKTPQAVGLDQFLNEARKVNPGVSDDELTRYYNKKYGQ